jgi:hypothetical protein
MLITKFWCIVEYFVVINPWDGSVALVVYNFGGLAFKSWVVEACKYVYQKFLNDLDDDTNVVRHF